MLTTAAAVMLVCEVIADALTFELEGMLVVLATGLNIALRVLAPPFAAIMEDSLAKTLERAL